MKTGFYYGDKRNTGDYDNGVWMDILKIPFLQSIEEAANYDLIIRTMWLESTGWSKTIRDRWPHVKQIGLSDHPLSTHIAKMSADRQYSYIKDLEYVDGIMVLTEEERQWYQVAMPSKPVVKVGLPFPTESYEERYGALRVPVEDRSWIGLGVGASDNDRNFISDVLVFQRLLLDFPDLKGAFLSIPSQLVPYCNFLCDRYPNMWIQERTNIKDYYSILSACKFVFNLADRNTPGRLQGEAAFFEVPVIGSDRLELQNELFPEFAVTPYELETATSIGSSLLQNPALAKLAGTRAHDKLAKYNYRASRRKYNSLLKQITG